MKSMTGYAYKETIRDNVTVSVEVKTYNSRFLDLSIHLPPWLSILEQRLRECVCSRFTRGKVDLTVRVKEENAPLTVSVNENAAVSYQKAITSLAKTLGIKEKPGLNMLLSLDGVLEIETGRDTEDYWEHIECVLDAAIDKAEEDRIREGKHTEEDILFHVSNLEECAAEISTYTGEIEASIKANLHSRFSELLGDRIDENRILSETAVLLMKYTISEELSRLRAHLKDFRNEIEQNPSPGKKLDFLSQEINREVNTIGSKTPMLEVSRAVVEMKNTLENIREQLRNVE